MKKKFLPILAMTCFLSGNSFAQDCTTSPSTFTNHVVSGCFANTSSGDTEFNDVVMLRQSGSIMSVDVLVGDVYDGRTLKKNVSTFTYDLSKVSGRIVEGDFNNDGFYNDFALIYAQSTTVMKIDVFTSTNAPNPTFTQQNYLTLYGYDANKVTGRVVSGDFDRDGKRDDIAMFYDYGNSETRIHMFTSNGSSFNYTGSSGFWSTIGYTANNISNRVVSGDFNRDGYKDDIAAFYDFGISTSIHVWLSTGSSFNYQLSTGWWNSIGYSASLVTGRVVSVNIDRNNKTHDDIAVFYDYGGGQTRLHTFISDGTKFTYSGSGGAWSSYGYTASQITGKVATIDTRSGIAGGKVGDIIALYDYGTNTANYHIWRSFNPIFGSPYVEYTNHLFCQNKSLLLGESELGSMSGENIAVYPNPTTGEVLVSNIKVTSANATVKVFNVQGKLILEKEFIGSDISLDLSKEENGLYLIQLHNNGEVINKKVIKE